VRFYLPIQKMISLELMAAVDDGIEIGDTTYQSL
jgi:hypothetical protein